MQPTAKNKLATFFQRTEVPLEINPHGLGSPPRNVIAGATSPTSPLGHKHEKLKLAEQTRLPSVNFAKTVTHSNGAMGPPESSPRIKQSASQRRPLEERNGWESAPPPSLEPGKHQMQDDENEVGLRERWEEQSNMHSLFSESVPTISGREHDEDDTKSDILGDRGRSRRGHNGHRTTDSLPSAIGRHRSHRKRSAEKPPLFNVGKNGNFITANIDPNKFSTSMITHAPRGLVPESSVFRQDPFASTSEDTSPLPIRGGAFLRSEFPHRGTDVAKGFSHVERAAFHQDAAKKLSPEKYDDHTDAVHPQTFAKSVRVTSISDQRPPVFQDIEDAGLGMSDTDDSGALSPEDDFQPQHANHKISKKRLSQPDATVVFNPQKPIVAQNPPNPLLLQPDPLQASPMSRFIGHKSPSKRAHAIDYDDDALQSMSFEELRNEPFDHDPTREVPQSPAKPPVDNLRDRLKFYGGKDEGAQTQLFTQMSVRDWEDSGDWFLEQFGDIVRRMKEARQAKRRMADHFETEVSDRAEAVRSKKENIDRKLSKLKDDSFAMMKGKELDE
ncbi:unnamed protein product [Discula destructiva]